MKAPQLTLMAALLSSGMLSPLPALSQENDRNAASEITLPLADLGFHEGLVISPAHPDHTISVPAELLSDTETARFHLYVENQFRDYHYAALRVFVNDRLTQVQRLEGNVTAVPIDLAPDAARADQNATIRFKLVTKFNEDACFDERLGPGFLTLLPNSGFSLSKDQASLQLAWMKLGQTPEIVLSPTASSDEIATAAFLFDILLEEGRRPAVVSTAATQAGQVQIVPTSSEAPIRVGADGIIHLAAGDANVLRALEMGVVQKSAARVLNVDGIDQGDWVLADQRPAQRAFAYETGQVSTWFDLSDFDRQEIPATYRARIVLPPEETAAPSQLYVSLNGSLLHSEPVRATGEPHDLKVRLDPDLLELHNKLTVSIMRNDVAGECRTRPEPTPFEIMKGAHFETQKRVRQPVNFVDFATQIGDDLTVLANPEDGLSPERMAHLAGQLSFHYRSAGGQLTVQEFDPEAPMVNGGIYLSDIAGVSGVSATMSEQNIQISPQRDAGVVRLFEDGNFSGLQVTSIGGGSLPVPKRLDLSRGSLAVFDAGGTRYEFSTKDHQHELTGDVAVASILGSERVPPWTWIASAMGLIGLAGLFTTRKRRG